MYYTKFTCKWGGGGGGEGHTEFHSIPPSDDVFNDPLPRKRHIFCE